MTGKAQSFCISFYENDIGTIQKWKQKKNIKHDSSMLQQMIDFYDKNYGKSFIKNFMFFIGYPGIINIILMVISRLLFGIYEDMYQQGIPFEALRSLALSINLLAIAVFVFLATSIFLFIYKIKKEQG